MDTFSIGDQVDCFDSLVRKSKEFEDSSYTQLWRRNGKTLAGAEKRVVLMVYLDRVADVGIVACMLYDL